MPRRSTAGLRRPTIADIAQRAGVSKVSVSFALNGKPGLSDATRLRILAVAEEVGWHPNRAARALSAARAGACGLALARPARTLAYEPFFSKLLSGIEAEFSAHQVALVLQIVEDVEAEVKALRRWWAERRVDGALLIDLRARDPRIPLVEDLQMPAVVIGGPGRTASVPFFPGNDQQGIALMVEHLVALGHSRIDRVAGSPAFASTQVRSRVFRDFLARHGATGRVEPTDFSSTAGAEATRRLLSEAPLPTAIVYDNDIMAVAGLSVAHEMGFSVPNQLSLVCFDDSLFCELVRPSLTACARDIEAYGAWAARGLLCLIDGEPLPEDSAVTYQLVTRTSTSRAPRRPRRA